MNTIKKEKMRIFSLILVECSILLFLSFGIAFLLYTALGYLFENYHVLMTLLCALPIGALILLREKKDWCKKIPEDAFSVILAGLTGVLLYTLVMSTGADKFWLYSKFAFALFLITAGLGYYFSGYVRKWKQELYAFGIIAITIGFELVVIFINSKLNGIIIAGGICLSLSVFNMADFAKMSEKLDHIPEKGQQRLNHLVIATQLFFNFIGMIYLQDATRLFFRFFYELINEKTLKIQN